MTKGVVGFDQRQIVHRGIWENKRSIRLLYRDIVSTDVLPFPGIDVVADAHRLPFPDDLFTGVVMLDVLHHLERPIEFLKEASRVLKSGGRLAMIEPAMTPIARRFYDYFHDEPVDMNVDPFASVAINPVRDPFDANQAIPTLLFASATARARVEQTIPQLRVRSVKWTSLLAYPMSGGFQSWSLIPAAMVDPMLKLEAKMPTAVRKLFAFRMMVVLERL
jgi:SAM-dependent methyltransferase